MLALKPDVKLTGLSPQIVLAMVSIHSIFEHASVPCVITSANDSKHSTASLHYAGKAVDVRTKTWTSSKLALRDQIKACLGNDFDVVLEAEGLENEHLHVEYDPKE